MPSTDTITTTVPAFTSNALGLLQALRRREEAGAEGAWLSHLSMHAEAWEAACTLSRCGYATRTQMVAETGVDFWMTTTPSGRDELERLATSAARAERAAKLEAHAQALRQLITAEEHATYGKLLDHLDDLIEDLTDAG